MLFATKKEENAELTKFLRIQASFEGKFVGAGIKTYTNSDWNWYSSTRGSEQKASFSKALILVLIQFGVPSSISNFLQAEKSVTANKRYKIKLKHISFT